MEQKELFSLLARVRAGEDGAFSTLSEHFCGLTQGLVRRFKGDLCEADTNELLQEAHLALYRAACTYQENKDVTFGLYARVCVRNALVSFLRTRREAPKGVSFCDIDTILLSDEREPVGSLMEEERLVQITAVIAKVLSPYEHRVFEGLLAGEEIAEIAEKLGKSEKSVSNAVFRMQVKLRGALDTN